MSKTNWLKFLDIRLISFAGFYKGKQAEIVYPEGFKPEGEFDPSGGVVIIFPPDHRYVEATGDQGTGKTSWLTFLKESAGLKMMDRWINTTDNSRKYDRTFIGKDGKHYMIKATKTEFNLFEMLRKPDGSDYQRNYKNDIQLRKVSDAKQMLYQLIGPPGLSPMDIASKSGADQIQWLKSVALMDEELKRADYELKKEIDKNYNARKMANQETNRLQTILDADPYFKKQAEAKKYFETTNFDNIEEEIQETNRLYEVYRTRENNIANLKEDISNVNRECYEIEEQIKRLQGQLIAKQEAVKIREESLKEAEEWLVANEYIRTKYEATATKVKEASEFKMRKNQYEQMLKNLSEYNHWSDESIRLTNRLDELRKAKEKFIADITPDVPGLKVFVADAENPKEGLEYKDQPLSMLCESDQWEWYAAYCKAAGIMAIYLENVSSMGTGAVEKFNEFIEAGGWVFATRMDRGVDHFRLTFKSKIPL